MTPEQTKNDEAGRAAHRGWYEGAGAPEPMWELLSHAMQVAWVQAAQAAIKQDKTN
jgi:hypothetical protein